MASRIQVVARHGQCRYVRAKIRATHPRAQRRPTTPVPLCDAIDRVTPRRPEIAPYIHVIAQNRQCTNVTVRPRTQRRPTGPIPFGDPLGRNISGGTERTADIEITRSIHYRRVNRIVHARKTAKAAPVGIAEGWILCRDGETEQRTNCQHRGANQLGPKSAELTLHKLSTERIVWTRLSTRIGDGN